METFGELFQMVDWRKEDKGNIIGYSGIMLSDSSCQFSLWQRGTNWYQY